MPISREEFEKLRQMGPTLEDEIENFLNAHRETAYTSVEIVRVLFPTAVILPINDSLVMRVEEALQSLLSEGRVVGRVSETSTGIVRYFSAS